jgi:large subunit ribosomal protein L9
MKVILLENIIKIGSIGDIIDVKRGFARNFLISKKKALFASKTNMKEVEIIKQELSKKDQEKKKQAKSIQEKIKNKVFEIEKLSTENKELYGSVKPTEISKILEDNEKIKINPSQIQPVKEIKSLGEFKVMINLHSEVQEQIVVKVIPQKETK